MNAPRSLANECMIVATDPHPGGPGVLVGVPEPVAIVASTPVVEVLDPLAGEGPGHDPSLDDSTNGHSHGGNWRRRYASYLLVNDSVVVVLVLGLALWRLVLMGTTHMQVKDLGNVPYWPAAVMFGIVWLLALKVTDSRSEHVVGHGFAEYRRTVDGTLVSFILAVTFSFFVGADLSRSLVLIAAPVGVAALVVSRWGWRQWLRTKQRSGAYLHRAVIIGERSRVQHIIAVMNRSFGTGYQVVGAITRIDGSTLLGGVPVLADYEHAVSAIDEVGADTLIVSSADDLSPTALRHLGWKMAERDIEWVVAPALTDIAGPRIHARPVAGLPLVHVSFPRLQGTNRVLKRSFDLVGSAALVLVLSPAFLIVALVVGLSSSGPIFYRQERIGRGGVAFGMLKFRSMVQNADDQLASLLDLQGTSDTPLFKINNDPRITPAGRFLRKYSLDELPQLVNVLFGDMSLVGPRPQRPAEVVLYDSTANRRLLVKPGMSGLWQVSGRSALSWDDALRLDLYYVENWSLAQDVIILLRTFRAVLFPEGTAH